MFKTTGWIARSNVNTKMIFCTDGEFHHEMHVGPGGYCAKIYKTQRGAAAVRNGTVVPEKIEE